MKKERKQLLKTFRKGNKMMRSAINYQTCPLGDCNGKIRGFEGWLEDLKDDRMKKYFEKAYGEGIEKTQIRYNKPVVRGRDGLLYSAADMDDAMTSSF